MARTQSIPYGVSTDQYAVRMSKNAQGLIEYIGEAHPGQQLKTSQPVWRIKKMIYDGANFNTAVLWANADKNFIFRWSLRATYTY